MNQPHFESCTHPLDPKLLRSELEFVPTYLGARGLLEAQAMVGFGSDLHPDLLWKELVLPIYHLVPWVDQQIRAQVLRLGFTDLVIHATGSAAVQWVFCHEGDIHFASPDAALVDEMVAPWRAAGIGCYRSAGLVIPGPSRIEWIDCP